MSLTPEILSLEATIKVLEQALKYCNEDIYTTKPCIKNAIDAIANVIKSLKEK